MRFLPAKVHEVLDYVVGLALIFAPNIFGFSDVGGAAATIPRVIGVASILMGLTTRGYGFAPLKLIPLKTHLAVDFLAGVFLAISPWLFSFSDEKANAWVPHLVVGIALVGVALTTQTTTDSPKAHTSKA